MALNADADYPPNDPRNRQHEKHHLYAQIDQGVEQLSARVGGVDPDTNARTKMSLFNQADKDGLKSVDHLVVNRKGTEHEAGTLAIMVDGKDPYNPGNRRACMELVEAAQQQINDSLHNFQFRHQKTNAFNNPVFDQNLAKNFEQAQAEQQPDRQQPTMKM